ncbi:hypothetical protein GCM10027048_24110 [Hymenobacter coalescens]
MPIDFELKAVQGGTRAGPQGITAGLDVDTVQVVGAAGSWYDYPKAVISTKPTYGTTSPKGKLLAQLGILNRERRDVGILTSWPLPQRVNYPCKIGGSVTY